MENKKDLVSHSIAIVVIALFLMTSGLLVMPEEAKADGVVWVDINPDSGTIINNTTRAFDYDVWVKNNGSSTIQVTLEEWTDSEQTAQRTYWYGCWYSSGNDTYYNGTIQMTVNPGENLSVAATTGWVLRNGIESDPPAVESDTIYVDATSGNHSSVDSATTSYEPWPP